MSRLEVQLGFDIAHKSAARTLKNYNVLLIQTTISIENLQI